MNEIEIRLCSRWEDCVQCEELQKRVWQMPDYRDAVPANLLITAVKNGGLLIGAFDGAQMIGFAFGFLGSERAVGSNANALRLKHTSHMLAVLPEARVRGLGARLKWFQRAAAIKQGLDLMTWTYDPLQAINAHLNLSRLGAIARHYSRDAYGEMTDALNAGMASDRFEVEWFLQSERVRAKEKGEGSERSELANAPRVYEIEWTRDALPRVVDAHALFEGTNLVEIPSDINALKAQNLELAAEWREITRGTFERAFAMGYAAVDFFREVDRQGHARAFYVTRLAEA